MKNYARSIKFASTIVLFSMMLNAQSATTDLASAPLITSPTASVLPNVFLMLDDSGSMGWDYMPDNAGNFGIGTYGAASGHCNGVFYDPNITYDPPVTSTGASYANASFTLAWNNGYNTGGSSTNLSTSFRPTGGTAVPAFYFIYTGTQTTEKLKDYYNTNSTFYKECNSTVGSSPGLGKFTSVTVSATSGPGATDERINFANWWSYYHTRMLTMKTATGKAFSSIGNTFRVGYASINNNTGSDILALNTFDAAQKLAWYAKLYAATTNNSTPLREALSDIGLMYAHKLPASNASNALTSSVPDPIQYSCQQNFTILTTDGFWNGNAGVKLDGSTAVGNQDYAELRPMFDGSSGTVTTTTPYTTLQTYTKTTTGATSTTITSTVTKTKGSACSTAATTVPPSGAVSAYMSDVDNAHHIALALSTNAPDATRCYKLGGTGAGTAWICRGSGNSGDPAAPATESTVTDSTGKAWYLVQSGSTLPSTCVNDQTAFADTKYSAKNGACPGVTSTGSGFTVTTVTTDVPVTTSGQVRTEIETYTADQSTTQSTTNGIIGATSALTPTTPTYSFTSATTPTYTGTAVNTTGTSTTNTTSACIVSPPANSTVVSTATSSTGGSSVSTLLNQGTAQAGTPVVTSSPSGGTSDTLADVAEYYYTADLRTTALGNQLSAAPGFVGVNIENNNVPSSGLDGSPKQHMTTFTLGLGARGKMVFDPGYASASSGDFNDVRQGNTANGSTVCPWQTSGSCNWPTPGADKVENIDDLWHAAVNGRGTYFSAANPTGLATALSSALAGVSARTGSAAAATTSNAFVTQGDNFLFRSTFVSQQWTGELIRQELDVGTGAVLPAINWTAQTALDLNANRKIYFYDTGCTTAATCSSTGSNLSSFTLPNLTTAGLNNSFTTAYIASLSQLTSGSTDYLAIWTASTPYVAGNEYLRSGSWYHVNTAYTSGTTFGTADTNNSSVVNGPAGVNLVNFIRGDRTYEGATTDTDNGKYYHQRNHLLGDIVNSETTYVKSALSPGYTDPGYTAFKTSMADRQGMVYVGANDGMLHAFYAANNMISMTTGHIVTSGGTNVVGGAEAWAFIPTAVMPKLYKLADKKYDTQHEYFVDGSPITADICVSSCASTTSAVWKTILVGGLNSGGKGYYALDITNPAAPKALWEFTHANMGLTFGHPKIVKLKPTVSYPTGQWVVLLTSGYNNTSGDGKGYLYVVDANTGALATSVNSTGIIGTGVGSVATPSGLGYLDAPLSAPGINATATAVYAGDLLGNLWRFDINGDVGASGYEAQLLVTLLDPNNNPQEITTKPLLSLVDNTLVIYIGTGKYLGSSDLTNIEQQSFYAIKDTYPTTSTAGTAIYATPRSLGSNFVTQYLTTTTCPVGTSTTICSSGQLVIKSTSSPVNFASQNGWFFDFPLEGERVNTDPAIIDRTLLLNTNVPSASSCSVGGDSYQYQINYLTGGAVSSAPGGIIGTKMANELSTRPVVATLLDGTNKSYSQGSGGGTPTSTTVWKNPGGGGGGNLTGPATRRSWRILIQK